MKQEFTICIIDDDDIYQFMIKRIIKSNVMAKKVLTFSDGEEAIDFLVTNKCINDLLPDVIFLDINMPIMDGWQFLEQYVKIRPSFGKKITVYMVSSSVDPRDLERAHRISDVSDYLVKPITGEKLKEIIDTLPLRQMIDNQSSCTPALL